MKKVAIIGGGLAGTALAYVLKRAGVQPVIYEAGDVLACGASGNRIGLYNPIISALRTVESDYFMAAFSLACRTFQDFQDIDWNPCGTLHLMIDERREKRYNKAFKNLDWDEDHLRLLNSKASSEISGIDLKYGALYVKDSGYLSPEKLCAAYARGIEVHLNTEVESLLDVEADIIILACGKAVSSFDEVSWLPLQAVRGQVSLFDKTLETKSLACNLCYGGGYLSPAHNGVHALGASFQPWLDNNKVENQDNEENLAKLFDVAPALASGIKISQARASVRTTTPDRFPVVGRVSPARAGSRPLYVSTSHGSHGIISTIMAAHFISDMIMGRTLPLPKSTIERLDPLRYDRTS